MGPWVQLLQNILFFVALFAHLFVWSQAWWLAMLISALWYRDRQIHRTYFLAYLENYWWIRDSFSKISWTASEEYELRLTCTWMNRHTHLNIYKRNVLWSRKYPIQDSKPSCTDDPPQVPSPAFLSLQSFLELNSTALGLVSPPQLSPSCQGQASSLSFSESLWGSQSHTWWLSGLSAMTLWGCRDCSLVTQGLTQLLGVACGGGTLV